MHQCGPYCFERSGSSCRQGKGWDGTALIPDTMELENRYDHFKFQWKMEADLHHRLAVDFIGVHR